MLASIALLAAGGLVFVSAVAQHLNTVGSRGMRFVFTDRSAPLSREGFAGRAARTLQNNLESAGMVVPAATVLVVTGTNTGLIAAAAMIYAAARVGFTISYWTGVSRLRSLFWGVGMATIAVLSVNAVAAACVHAA